MKFFCNSILILFTSFFGFSQCETVTLESIANPGPYTVSTLTEADGIRNGPDYNGATIYYPVNATPPFAGIAVVPGYCGVETDIQEWGPFYASHGIVAITLGTNDPCADWPAARAIALLDAIETVKEENSRANSPLQGNIDVNRFAVSGWSMGGGGSQLAASIDPTLKAVIGLCPWLDLNGFEPSDLIHDAPVLIFTGQNDDVANPAEYGYMHYQGTPESTDKLYFEITNGGHDAANGPDRADGDAGVYALSWLKAYLIGDSCYCEFLLEIPLSSSAYETNIDCPEITSISEQSDFKPEIVPNPVYGNNILFVSAGTSNRSFYINDSSGKVYMKGILLPLKNEIDVNSLHPGTYYLNVNNDSFKFIKID
jgi:dienelactone hydrolase